MKGRIVALIGAVFGDEGKGAIGDNIVNRAYDLEAPTIISARATGGPNAGHTVRIPNDQDPYKLHHFPCGILTPKVNVVLGNGMVIDPEAFMKELGELEERGIDVLSDDRLRISHCAHIITPAEILCDKVEEKKRAQYGTAIGTTGRGIGPCYAQKAHRKGLRMEIFRDSATAEAEIIRYLGTQRVMTASERREIGKRYAQIAECLGEHVTDTAFYLHEALADGAVVIGEGAQGSLLHPSFGTYPFVTSSPPTIGGMLDGLGVPPAYLWKTLGIVKASSMTRVGSGPFPTEVKGRQGKWLQQKGNEVGTTTGRPRRCGWLDLVLLKYAAGINGFTGIALTKFDVIPELQLNRIPICTAYRLHGEKFSQLPEGLANLEDCIPVYTYLESWSRNTTGVIEFEDLSKAAQNYIRFLEEQLGLPVELISTGPYRNQIIDRRNWLIV